ncbi:MAG: hypothetical protein ACFE9L_21235 [Candidatus Hodarchaeota archaeon]
MVSKTASKKIRFQLPSTRNHFCEMRKTDGGYKITFFNMTRKLKTIEISEAQLDRQYLHKVSINAGIEFYALTGPYDTADEILRQWYTHFEKKGLLSRLLGR